MDKYVLRLQFDDIDCAESFFTRMNKEKTSILSDIVLKSIRDERIRMKLDKIRKEIPIKEPVRPVAYREL